MSSIQATFEPSSDGSIHLPIPKELQGEGRLRVVAWMEPDTDTAQKTGAGEWAKKSAGIACHPDETAEDARYDALKQKFQLE